MSADRLRGLRANLVVLIVLLALQFELGMAVNLSDLHTIPAFGFSIRQVFSALGAAGGAAVAHGILGTLLALGGIGNLVQSVRSARRGIRIVGVILFVTMVLSAVNGYLFVLSGFQNDGYSHGMSTTFIVTLLLCFLELYFARSGRT